MAGVRDSARLDLATIPPGLSGLAFVLQQLTVSSNAAPNGLFFISNVELLVLP